jgi:hypothetical protein
MSKKEKNRAQEVNLTHCRRGNISSSVGRGNMVIGLIYSPLGKTEVKKVK